MKKIYLSVSTIFVLLSIPALVLAQPFTGGVFQTIPAGGPLSVSSTWVGPQPPAYCNNCQIKIFGNSTVDVGVSRMDNHSQLIIESGAVLTVNQRFTIADSSEILVGSDASGAASIVMNAEADLYRNSFIRLANPNTNIDATSFATSATDSLPTDVFGVGFYYINGATDYNILISTFGAYGDPTRTLFPQYNINCNPSNPPPTCTQGIVFGPAKTDTSAADQTFEFLVFSTLPVVLEKFAATLTSSETVNVSWSTSQEINSYYYAVQRSTNAANFTEIGRVQAKGFSSITTDYSYTDHYAVAGMAYYRLQMVDLDGKYKYSKVVTVSKDAKPVSLLVFNNPFTDQVRLELYSNGTDQLLLTLTDLTGRSILKQSYSAQAGSNFINIRPSNTISGGIYLLNIKGNTLNRTLKLVKK